MRASGLLQAELIAILAALGHGETVVLSDAGLPTPPGVRRIDLAVAPGLPPLLPVLEAVLGAAVFEAATVSHELTERAPGLARAVAAALGPAIPLRAIRHTELKAACVHAVAVVRTGEFTPFANVLLQAGVAFR
jgi:D-ribose pyranase